MGSVKSIKGIPKPMDMLDGPEHEAHDSNEEFADFLGDAVACAPYMLGVYGWKLLIYMHRASPLKGIRKLLVHRVGASKITGDNCFRCYESAVGSHIGTDSVDVVRASFVGAAGEQVSTTPCLGILLVLGEVFFVCLVCFLFVEWYILMICPLKLCGCVAHRGGDVWCTSDPLE
jgi:hypothetical protein